MADALKYAMGEAYAVDVLSQWAGFGRFCTEVPAIEPLTILQALRLAQNDPAADVLENYPEARADEAKAAKWAENWQGNWDRRFSMRTT